MLRNKLFWELNEGEYYATIIISPIIQIFCESLNISFIFRKFIYLLTINKRLVNNFIDEFPRIKAINVTIHSLKLRDDQIMDEGIQLFFNRISIGSFAGLILCMIFFNVVISGNYILLKNILFFITLLFIFILFITLKFFRKYKIILLIYAFNSFLIENSKESPIPKLKEFAKKYNFTVSNIQELINEGNYSTAIDQFYKSFK